VSEWNGPAGLVKTPCTLYGDEPTLLSSRQAVLAGLLDKAFKSVKKDHRRLF
jgi:hypothetical protein